MTDYYEIRDRVPRAEIDALTVEAVRVWLERNGWTFEAVRVWLERNGWTFESSGGGGGIWSKGDDAFAQTVNIPWKPRAIQHGAWELGKRAHVVIDEIRAIAEWQARCAAWVAPEGMQTRGRRPGRPRSARSVRPAATSAARAPRTIATRARARMSRGRRGVGTRENQT